ncbi:hypothetical protein Tco_0140388 [Tanacetum coccineum]
MKWLPKLTRYDYEVVSYKKVSGNGAVDALSRHRSGAELLSMFVSTFTIEKICLCLSPLKSYPGLEVVHCLGSCKTSRVEVLRQPHITHQLLWSSGGESGPGLSFDKLASLERLFSLACDLKRNMIVGTGDMNGGLYLFDATSDQVLQLLKDDLKFDLKNESVTPCDPNPKRPYDEGRVPCNGDGTDSSSLNEDDDESDATSIEDNAHPEGNPENLNHSDESEFLENNDEDIDLSDHIDYDDAVESVRKSSRQSKLPANLNDYVIDIKVKFGLNKVVNYCKLSNKNLCFTTALNKSFEPSRYKDAITDNNWVEAVNNEMESLNRNHT